MDEELKLKLLSLIKNPESILPNLRLSRPSQAIISNEVLKPQTLSEEAEPSPKKQRKDTNCCTRSQNTCNYHGMSGVELRSLIQGNKVIEFCQEVGLIATEVTCSCGNLMLLRSRRDADLYVWICHRSCHSSKTMKSVRKGTWFEKSNLGIGDILWMAYMWVHEYSYISFLHECDHSSQTVMTWCAVCIDLCRKIIEFKNNPIGGKEKTVDIFVCEINHDKNTTQWAFCAVERNSTNSLCITIDDKKSSTLLQIFLKFIQPGTNVIASNWSFLNLNLKDFGHLTKEQSIEFTDLVTNEKMETYKAFKMRTTRPNIQDEWSELKYGPNLFEVIYRKNLKSAPDAFLTFLNDVALIHKPIDKYCTCFIEVFDYKSISMKSRKCQLNHNVNKKLE